MSAGDHTLAYLADCVKKARQHDHPPLAFGFINDPTRYDTYCLSLLVDMGEHMSSVLDRITELQAEVRMWQDRHTALAEEAAGYLDKIAELEAES